MKTNNSIEKPDWSIMGRYLSGETNTAETKAIETWAAATEQNQQELEQYKLLLRKTDKLYQVKKFDTDKAWKNVHQRTVSAASSDRFILFRKKTASIIYKYAAILLVGILLGSAGYYLFKKQTNPVYTEIVSNELKAGKEFILPDGSVVTLNSKSRLEYPENFDKEQREVTVTGEAFFDVKPDPERPFLINAGDAVVRVLGTSFNVNAYPEAESVEVTVKSGTVQVACCEGEEQKEAVEILLNAGEKGILFKANRKLEKTLSTDQNYMAWKTHNLVFKKTQLSEVVHYLNNIYHIDIQLENKDLENLKLTAEFNDKSAIFILDVIRLTFDLDLKEENGIYIFSGKTALNK